MTANTPVAERPAGDGMADRSRGFSREAVALASIVALAIAVMLAVDPRGEFPLNDDWCYAKASALLRQAPVCFAGNFRPSQSSRMALSSAGFSCCVQ